MAAWVLPGVVSLYQCYNPSRCSTFVLLSNGRIGKIEKRSHELEVPICRLAHEDEYDVLRVLACFETDFRFKPAPH